MLTPHLNISHSGFVVVQIMDNNTNTSSYEYKENNDGMAAAVLILVIIFSVVAFLICVCVIVTVIICCCAAAVGINQAAKPPARGISYISSRTHKDKPHYAPAPWCP